MEINSSSLLWLKRNSRRGYPHSPTKDKLIWTIGGKVHDKTTNSWCCHFTHSRTIAGLVLVVSGLEMDYWFAVIKTFVHGNKLIAKLRDNRWIIVDAARKISKRTIDCKPSKKEQSLARQQRKWTMWKCEENGYKPKSSIDRCYENQRTHGWGFIDYEVIFWADNHIQSIAYQRHWSSWRPGSFHAQPFPAETASPWHLSPRNPDKY